MEPNSTKIGNYIIELTDKLQKERARIKALEAELAAHAWTMLIDDKGRAVEGAELPGYEGITASVYFPKLDKSIVHFVYYKAANRTFCYHGNGAPIKDGIVYAYIVKPTPAPYPGRETITAPVGDGE